MVLNHREVLLYPYVGYCQRDATPVPKRLLQISAWAGDALGATPHEPHPMHPSSIRVGRALCAQRRCLGG